MTPNVIYDLRRAVAWTRLPVRADVEAAAGMDLVSHVILPVRRTLDRQVVVSFLDKVPDPAAPQAPVAIAERSLGALRGLAPGLMLLQDAIDLLHGAGKRVLVRDDSQWQAAAPDWDTREAVWHEMLDFGDGSYTHRSYNQSRAKAAAGFPGQWRMADAIDATSVPDHIDPIKDATHIAVSSETWAMVWQAAAEKATLVMRPTSVVEAIGADENARNAEVEIGAWLVRDQEHVRPVLQPEPDPDKGRGDGEKVVVAGRWAPITAEPGGEPRRIQVAGYPQEAVGVMPYGAASWRDMVAPGAPVFHIAHRGGSLPWHEHTAAAYTQSVAHGCEALEISCHLTKDGVWIASHDLSLERVSGPKGKKVSELTLAEIRDWYQAFPSLMPVTLEELIKGYGGSHVLVVDPKNDAAQVDSMLDMLAPIAPRVLIKFFWDAGWLFKKVRARPEGFGTLAYAYNASAEDTQWQKAVDEGFVDVCMVEWNAPQDMWDRIKRSSCVPVGHITEERQHVQMAVAAGARGVMDKNPELLPLRA